MDDLVEEMLSQAPMLITSAELANYRRRAQAELTKARIDERDNMKFIDHDGTKIWNGEVS